jgi:hypothetical protein
MARKVHTSPPFSLHNIQRCPKAHPASDEMGTGDLSLRVMSTGCETDHLSSSSEVRNAEAIPALADTSA